MNKTDLKHLAIEKLNTKEIKNIKKQICQKFKFIDIKHKKDCMSAFDKNFIKSFISTHENQV